MHIFKQNYKLLVITILIMASLGSFLNHKFRAPKKRYADFHCYYVTGKRILNQQNIYVIKDKEIAEFRYTPVFAVVMSALAFMNENDADTAWYIINFFLMVISLILLKKLIIPIPEKFDYKTSLTLYTLTIIGVIRFIFHNFDAGQSNILVMSCIIIGLYYISKKRQVLGGAIFAFSIMIKYTPLIFIPYFLLRRRFKLSLIIITFILIYLILPSLFIGPKANILYVKNIIPFLINSTILEKSTLLDPKNQSLYSLLQRIFTNCALYFYAPPMPFASLKLKDAAINLISIISALIIYFMVLYNPKKMHPTKSGPFYYPIDYAQLLICVILFNLNAWMHNYILLSMAYFIIVYYLIKSEFKDKTVLVLLVFSYILNIITLNTILGQTLAYKLQFYSPHTISALITFFLLFKLKFSKNPDIFLKSW